MGRGWPGMELRAGPCSQASCTGSGKSFRHGDDEDLLDTADINERPDGYRFEQRVGPVRGGDYLAETEALGEDRAEPCGHNCVTNSEVGFLGRVVEEQSAGAVRSGKGRDPGAEIEDGDPRFGREHGLNERLVRSAGNHLAADAVGCDCRLTGPEPVASAAADDEPALERRQVAADDRRARKLEFDARLRTESQRGRPEPGVLYREPGCQQREPLVLGPCVTGRPAE